MGEITVATAASNVVNLIGDLLTYVFNFTANPVIATVAFLPIISVAIALVTKLIHHKHKV